MVTRKLRVAGLAVVKLINPAREILAPEDSVTTSAVGSPSDEDVTTAALACFEFLADLEILQP